MRFAVHDSKWFHLMCCHMLPRQKTQQLASEANQQTMTWRSADPACHRYALCRWCICPKQDSFGRICRGRRCAQNSAGRPKNLLKRSSDDAFTKEKYQKFDWDTLGFFLCLSRHIYIYICNSINLHTLDILHLVLPAAEGKLLNFRWRPDSIFAVQKK